MERVVQLYKDEASTRLLFSNRIPLSWRMKAVAEMTALAKQLGVPAGDIFTEESSYLTYDNVLYVKEVMQAEPMENRHRRHNRLVHLQKLIHL